MRETIPGRQLLSDERIFWQNRCYKDHVCVHCDLTLSGFSVMIEGEELIAEIDADANMQFGVICDGKELPRVVTKTRGLQTVYFAKDISLFARHRIDVYRLTEQSEGTLSIHSLTARKFLPRPEEKPELITFYGDSLTCAYGNEGDPKEEYRRETQNPLKGYAYLLCKARNADHEVFGYSGISVSEKVFVTNFTLGDICFYNSCHMQYSYLYPRKSDIVVINIGTNDASAINRGVGTKQGLENGLYNFTCKVIEKHPGAKIVLTSGLSDTHPEQGAITDAAFARLQRRFPDVMLRFVFPRNVAGANGHPSVEGHINAANALISFLAEKVPVKGSKI
ncbi:MAG: hypothetical protein IIW27_00095 [Clostridia bacterium]|nr:hypothetical protein [Clostridia bacterium]